MTQTTRINIKLAKWLYSLRGPTTLHLEHEFALWISLSILTVSSLQALYRNSFGFAGDFIFIMLVVLWLARHMILRYIYTTDVSTTRSPTLMGVFAHWLTSIAAAGQYFDRSDVHVVARHVGIAHVEDVLNPTSPFALTSLSYTIHFFRAYLLDPLLRLSRYPKFLKAPLLFFHSFQEILAHPAVQRLAFYGPPLQLMISFGIGALCIFFLQPEPPPRVTWTYPISMQRIPGQDGLHTPYASNDIDPQNAYQPLHPPSWGRVFFFICSIGTILSVLCYGRISFPIPDLVAGTNVLKALRHEARGPSAKTQKSRIQKDQQDGPWSEFYKFSSGENRFRLASIIMLLRMIDAVIICAVLPRTGYVCRATGHCPSTPTFHELSRIIFPHDTSGLFRPDSGYKSMFDFINPDKGSAFITILSIFVVSFVLLMAQLVTVNRSYLAIMGHLAGEWKLVDSKGKEATSQWDPRRRYKKGDLITYSYSGLHPSVYMATTNSPEGRPFDLFLRATHELFQYELGHQSTSGVIAILVVGHIVFMSIISFAILYYMARGYSEQSLLTSLFANVVACCGVLQIGLIDHKELEDVAAELNAS